MTMHHPKILGSRSKARGFSLVELMISMTIGLVVIATVLVAFLSSGMSGKHATALGQISEDASVALGMLRTQIAMAGYSRPYGTNPTTGRFDRTYTGNAVFGCDHGFVDPTANPVPTCASSGDNDALIIYYEADASNAIVVSSLPTDCLGNGLTEIPLASPVPAHFVAENRFYASNTTVGSKTIPEIYCKGNASASTAGRPLVENITQVQFTYGVAADATSHRVVAYKDATGVGANWANVVSVRACIVVRSADNVMDAPTRYRDCTGDDPLPPAGDRHMYRSFTTTIVLHNRMGA
jgi:type IV pilus assembly protein PilW